MSKPGPQPDPEAVAYAKAERAKGRSYQDIADEMTSIGHSVSAMTIKRWTTPEGAPPPARASRRKAPRAAFKPPAVSAPRPASDAPAAPAQPPSAIETVRSILVEVDAQIKEAKELGDRRAMQLAAATLSRLAPVLARLEAAESTDDGALKFTREDIDAAMAALEIKFRAICDRPLLCAECSRALSVQWGLEGGADPGILAPSEGDT